MAYLSYRQICSMKGNGSSARHLLKYFIEKGAQVMLIDECIQENYVNRLFIIELDGLRIPVKSHKLNLYSALNSALSLDITNNKLRSFELLKQFNINTPYTCHYLPSMLLEEILKIAPALVVKPRVGSHGEGISVGVNNLKDLQKAINSALEVDDEVLIQQKVAGQDYRLLFIDYKFVAAVRRDPAKVTGDGKKNVEQLINDYNENISRVWENIRRGNETDDSIRGSVSKIPIQEVRDARDGDFLDYVPSVDEAVSVLDKANVSLGGQTEDVTDEVDTRLIKRLAVLLRHIDLPICGVDVISEDIGNMDKSYVIELNGAPGLRLHEFPTIGKARPVLRLYAETLIKFYQQLAKRS